MQLTEATTIRNRLSFHTIAKVTGVSLDVIRDLNVMILEAPIPKNVMNKLRYIVDELEAEIEDE